MKINFFLRLYAILRLKANGGVVGMNENKCDYRSQMAILWGYTSLDEFERVWWSRYATWAARFCMVFRLPFLRFARLVQA